MGTPVTVPPPADDQAPVTAHSPGAPKIYFGMGVVLDNSWVLQTRCSPGTARTWPACRRRRWRSPSRPPSAPRPHPAPTTAPSSWPQSGNTWSPSSRHSPERIVPSDHRQELADPIRRTFPRTPAARISGLPRAGTGPARTAGGSACACTSPRRPRHPEASRYHRSHPSSADSGEVWALSCLQAADLRSGPGRVAGCQLAVVLPRATESTAGPFARVWPPPGRCVTAMRMPDSLSAEVPR
jgi:hypothetical protein